MTVADLAMEIFAMDSAWLRAFKLQQEKGLDKIELQRDMLTVFLHEAQVRLWSRSRQLLANVLPAGEALQKTLTTLDQLLVQPPVDLQAPLRRIATRLLDAGKFCA